MADVRKRLVFYGRVQGVGFRYTAKYLAKSLGLTGWVMNEYDGTVVMEIQGREPMIHKLMEGLNRNGSTSHNGLTSSSPSTGLIPKTYLRLMRVVFMYASVVR